MAKKIKPGTYRNNLFKYDGAIIEGSTIEVMDLLGDDSTQFIKCNVLMRRKKENRMLCIPINLIEKNIKR